MPLLLEIVTPERLAYSDTVDAVNLPGIEGELGVLPHHAPLVSMLGVGELRIRKGGTEESFAIVGGFLQVRPDKVVVMAETADMASEIDLEKAQEARRDAERLLEGTARPPTSPPPGPPCSRRSFGSGSPNAATARVRGTAADRRSTVPLGIPPGAGRPRDLPDRGRPAAVRHRPDQRRQERRAQAAGRGDPDR